MRLSPKFYFYRKILSQQKHYDWGLRALKTVIGGCKTALKMAKLSSRDGVDEMALVVQTLRLNTLSKLTYNDAQQFDALVSSTFRNAKFVASMDNSLSRAIAESFTVLGLQHNQRQVNIFRLFRVKCFIIKLLDLLYRYKNVWSYMSKLNKGWV